MKPLKVKELIKQLKEMDPEAMVLFEFYAEIGKKLLYGYFPHKYFETIKVTLKKGKTDWYLKSKDKKAKKAVVFC